jgi:hypothetical protein
VVWEKKSTAPVESYNIYRESVIAGQYDFLENVASEDLSIYTDTTADPGVKAYIYKITAMDAEGNESSIDLCKPHKTIHLLTSLNTEYGVAQLSWDHYYGFQYGTYHIYRSESRTGFNIVDEMSSSTTAWTDLNATSGQKYFYRVAVEKPEPCFPTGDNKKKKGTGPYYHSLSNMDDNKIQSTGIQTLSDVKHFLIYPNPMTDQTRIRYPNSTNGEYTIRLRDLYGKTVLIINNIRSDELVIRRNGLKSGYYSVEISGTTTYRSKLIVQ